MVDLKFHVSLMRVPLHATLQADMQFDLYQICLTLSNCPFYFLVSMSCPKIRYNKNDEKERQFLVFYKLKFKTGTRDMKKKNIEKIEKIVTDNKISYDYIDKESYEHILMSIRVKKISESSQILWYDDIDCIMDWRRKKYPNEHYEHWSFEFKVPAILAKKIGLLYELELYEILDDKKEPNKAVNWEWYTVNKVNELLVEVDDVNALNPISRRWFSDVFPYIDAWDAQKLAEYIDILYPHVYDDSAKNYLDVSRHINFNRIKAAEEKREQAFKNRLMIENENSRRDLSEKGFTQWQQKHDPAIHLISQILMGRDDYDGKDLQHIVGSLSAIALLIRRFILQESELALNRKLISLANIEYDFKRAEGKRISFEKVLNSYLNLNDKKTIYGRKLRAILLLNSAQTEQQELIVLVLLAWLSIGLKNGVKMFDLLLNQRAKRIFTDKLPDKSNQEINFYLEAWFAKYKGYKTRGGNKLLKYISSVMEPFFDGLDTWTYLTKYLVKDSESLFYWGLQNRFPLAIMKLEFERLSNELHIEYDCLGKIQSLVDDGIMCVKEIVCKWNDEQLKALPDILEVNELSVDIDDEDKSVKIEPTAEEMRAVKRWVTFSKKEQKNFNRWYSNNEFIKFYILSSLQDVSQYKKTSFNLKKKAYWVAVKCLWYVYNKVKSSSELKKTFLFPQSYKYKDSNMSEFGYTLKIYLFESIITSILHEERLEKVYKFSFSVYVEEYIGICGELEEHLKDRINQNLMRK